MPTLTSIMESSLPASLGEAAKHYKGKLEELDLLLARKDRARRSLVRKRTLAERELEEIEGVLASTPCGATDVTEFVRERGKLQDRLDELYLALAELDRERKVIRKRMKKMEPWVHTY